jgi:hypothetical protein
MSFSFTKSLRCLLHFSVTVWDGPDQCALDGEACNPLIDEACAPLDMNFSSMRSIKISSTNFSTALRSLDIHAHDQIYHICGQMLKVSRTGGEVSISTARNKLDLGGLR